MANTYWIYSIYHVAKADFLQRVRSYYFLITLGACVLAIYFFVSPIDASFSTMTLGNYRGIYNAALIGGMVAMCTPFFTLPGFYLVNNSVNRDVDTGVGQIIAATPISKLGYLTGKLLSNFAVLLSIILVIAVMTIVMFLIRGETQELELWKLLSPLLILTVPAMFFVAALATFFEAFSKFNRGLINILYFFLWIAIIATVTNIDRPQMLDVYGMQTPLNDIKATLVENYPDYNGESAGGLQWDLDTTVEEKKTFVWPGMNWRVSILLQRFFWILVAFALVAVASIPFRRFDPSYGRVRIRGKPTILDKLFEQDYEKTISPKIAYGNLPKADVRFSFLNLVKAELKIMLKRNSLWWLLITVGLFIATVFSPLSLAHGGLLPILWFCQILIWSKLGSREIANRSNQYIFSAAYPIKRQMTASLCAAALIALFLASPVILRSLIAGNLYSIYAIIVGAFFLPTFAMASGVWTGSGKLFEVTYTILWFGIMNNMMGQGIPFIDYIGSMEESQALGVANVFLGITMAFLVFAVLGRKRQIMV